MSRLALSILGRYPAAWRERYGAEMRALIEAGPVGPRATLDLLRGCAIERLLSVNDPVRHFLLFRIVTGIFAVMYFLGLFVGVAALASFPVLAGYATQGVVPISPEVIETVFWLELPLLAVSLWLLSRAVGPPVAETGKPPAVSRRIVALYAVLLIACGFAAGATGELSFTSGWRYALQPVMLLTFFYEPPSMRWPGDELFDTLGALRSTRSDLRWARMELERCEALYAGREPGPELRAARQEFARLTAQEASQVGALDAMGYRARFES